MHPASVNTGRAQSESGTLVVVIEDDPVMLKLVAGTLRDAGYRVVIRSGDEALCMADEPHLVVLGDSVSLEGAGETASWSAPMLALCNMGSRPADAFLPPPFSGEELLDAVKLLLTLSRDMHDVSPVTLVDVGAVLDGSLQMAARELDTRTRVVCEFDSQLRVHACPEQLSLIFLNLLLMAANRMDAQNRITNGIRVAGWRTADGRTVIEISDTGRRIESSELAHLFDRSGNLVATPCRGLSLSASQRIVHERGGTITVKTMTSGSSFRVELPTAYA